MFDNTSAKQLNNLYGQDVSGVQATLLGTRVAVAAVEAVGVGKVAKVGVDAAAGGAKFIGDNANDAKTGNLSFLDAVRLNKATDDLINAAKSGKDIDQYVDKLANLTTHIEGGDGRLVLGKLKREGDTDLPFGFIEEAKTNGGSWYQTPDSWFAKLEKNVGETNATEIAWQVDEKFLEEQLSSGQANRIDWVFAPGDSVEKYLTPPSDGSAKKIFDSFRAQEFRYIMQNGPRNGYVWNPTSNAFMRIGRSGGN